MERVVYLAGNIGNLSAKECTMRFEAGKEYLEDLGFAVRSPIRGKILTSIEAVEKNIYVYEPNEIVDRDLWDIDHAELILAMPKEGSIGTFMEIFYGAYVRHIPVIVVTESDKIRNHYWIKKFASKILPTVEEAIDYIGKWYV